MVFSSSLFFKVSNILVLMPLSPIISEKFQHISKIALWLLAISALSMIIPINSSLNEMIETLSS